MRKKPDDQQVGFLTNLLLSNVVAIVEHENAVRIVVGGTPTNVDFTVYVHYEDMGIVIGERGATADAIRRIVWTACKKTDRRADIRFVG